MTERDRPTSDREQAEKAPVFCSDDFREETEALINAKLDQELLQKAREYVEQTHDETYWEAVRREAEAFWDRRYDPDAPEDW